MEPVSPCKEGQIVQVLYPVTALFFAICPIAGCCTATIVMDFSKMIYACNCRPEILLYLRYGRFPNSLLSGITCYV